MVSGSTQAVDSAYIKANASLDNLEQKLPADTAKNHLRKVLEQDQKQDSSKNEGDDEQEKDEDYKYISVNKRKLKNIAAREKNWKEKQRRRPGGSSDGNKFLSNKLHYSPTDPEDRSISLKTSKDRCMAKPALTYYGSEY